MGAKKSKLNKDVLEELCSKTKFRNHFRDLDGPVSGLIPMQLRDDWEFGSGWLSS